MIRTAIAAAAALLIATPAMPQNPPRSVSPQSDQDQLNDQYARALAGGYKALFLCSAIANAEANGVRRSPESVHEWELSGIYPVLDPIIRDLPFEIVRYGEGAIINYVAVSYEVGAARYALYTAGRGCAVQPIGFAPDADRATPASASVTTDSRSIDPLMKTVGAKRVDVSGAFDGSYGEGRTTAVTVLQGGALVGEQYADGFNANTPQRTWSVAKSIGATIIGAAVHRGDADVMASARLGADESDPRRAITIDDALRMASGRYSDTRGNRTDPLYWGGTTVKERAQGWPLLGDPGTVYRYANNDTLAAIMAIEDTFADNPPAALFSTLDMTNTVAETDWQGNYVLSSQVWSTSRDLARLGQLYLQDGIWNGERILPEGWVDYVSSPSGPQPESRPWGYGAAWWLMNKSEGVPSDTIAAFGNRGQYVVVVPSREVVIVRRGENMVGTRFDIAAFTRDVLAALEEQ